MDGDRLFALDGIEANLNYILPSAEKPYAYAYDPPPGQPQRSGRYAERRVTIRNGRHVSGLLSLDLQGFTLHRHRSAVADFYDGGEVRNVYCPEVEKLVAAATGADRVVAFDHNLRNSSPSRPAGVKQPVSRVHNDFTEKSGPQRARAVLGDALADRLLKGRFAFVNAWRPIRGSLVDWPLALCDARSMQPSDFIATDLIYPDRVGETYAVTYDERHRWFYFPAMQRDEVVLIKCYDSDRARARFTAHAAFQDPTAPMDAPPRESIEVRTIALFHA
jgi:hypothetical protein